MDHPELSRVVQQKCLKERFQLDNNMREETAGLEKFGIFGQDFSLGLWDPFD